MGRWIDRRKRHKKKDSGFNPLSIWFVLYIFVFFGDFFARFMTGYVLVAKDPLDAEQYHVLQAYNYERALSYLAHLDPAKEAVRSVNAGQSQFLSNVPNPNPDKQVFSFDTHGVYPGVRCPDRTTEMWPEIWVLQPIADDVQRAVCEWTYCANRDRSLPITVGATELLVKYHIWAAKYNEAVINVMPSRVNFECSIDGVILPMAYSKAYSVLTRYIPLSDPFEF